MVTTSQAVFSSPFIQVFHDQELNILYSEWSGQASNMLGKEFKEHILQFVELVKTCRVTGFLTNSQKGHYTMGADIQIWHDTEIAPQYVALGIKKIAFLLAEHDFFAALSVQQTFEESQAAQIQTRFFADLATARAWFKS
ncbi:MAG: hypothetical protein MUC97_07700 [Bernardetiaceae bacterium]|jgi:hypothetical protein|nr:hypothetical protein [Bernardetiaceae bacterium]